MRGAPQDYTMPTSKEYEAHVRATYKICPCGKPATCFAHLIHLGKEKRSKPNWKHRMGVMMCDHCHDLYDARLNTNGGLQAYLDATGKDLALIAMTNLLNWLPMNQKLKAVRAVAQWMGD